MNASIDFGNTRIKIGLFENDQLVELIRVISTQEVLEILKANNVQNIIISSVTLPKEEILMAFSSFKNTVFLDKNTPFPIINGYGTPETLGYDRMAAAAGAKFYFPEDNCLIIDIGTAIKYDLVLADNTFKGGIISPGRAMRFKALHTFTKNLPLLDSTIIPDLVGNSTNSCMESGVMNGIVAEINGIIEEYIKKLKITILICGGDAPYFESKIKYPTFAAPNLVLEGLNRILQYNVNKI
ncbi:type III pantothenate kinase [Lacihabitans sp. LS3-19]|uniref:type III pantothenate kinase n=1 Tax=Lacihabitans sp. LS3-19 TaxID=2487335 RepID=UPI0020CD18CC|nr:type III pantothenate kinase [Lacihabitans sp. LS3-19]MCP9766839.1 type III pantothenate kinase [Lacihabitans sp. LS3-19]